MKTYYDTLGVLPTAQLEVIRAAYKALINIYHPDKYKGDNAFAHEMTLELNEAYETLRDSVRRQEYDDQLPAHGVDDDEDIFDDDGNWEFEDLERNWQTATEFLPELTAIVDGLKKISLRLAFAYKVCLLETKEFGQANKIADQMKFDFLSLYFGDNKHVQEYAHKLILSNRRDIALDLNKAIKVLGDSLEANRLTRKLDLKYGVPTEVNSNILKTWDDHYLFQINNEWLKYKDLDTVLVTLGEESTSEKATSGLGIFIAVITTFVAIILLT